MRDTIYCLYIINKSGGLIYQRDFSNAAHVETNDAIRLASILHSINVISCQISPVPHCHGIELLEADSFDLHCFQSLTGIKFILIVEPKTQNVVPFLKKLYEYYADYVLKNPFYETDMPIRCELFEKKTDIAIRSFPAFVP